MTDYKCNHCNKTYKSQRTFDRYIENHILKYHPEVEDEEYCEVDAELLVQFELLSQYDTPQKNAKGNSKLESKVNNYAIQAEVASSSPNDTSITKPVFKEKTINNEKNKIVSSVDIEMLNFDKLILLEKLNINIINYILDNEDVMRKSLRKFEDRSYDPFLILRKMKAKIINGFIPTTYDFGKFNDDGRVFATGGVSLQNICREIRHTLCRDTYKDLDFANCHPTLLKQMTTDDIKTPCLDFYINDRQKVLDTGITKVEIISIINGKATKINNGFGKRLRSELINVIYPSICKGDDWQKFRLNPKIEYNHQGKFLNKLLCEAERKCLIAMIDYFHSNGFMPDNIGVAIHDGIMLWKETFPTDTNEQIKILGQCSEHVKSSTGFDMVIVVKDMSDGIKIPEMKDEPIDMMPEGLSLNLDASVIKAQTRGLNKYKHRSCPTLSFDKKNIIWDDGDDNGRLSPFPETDDLFVYAGMSAGKTHQCIKALKKYDTVVWLSFRQSYTANVHGRLRKDGVDMKTYQAVEFKKVITSAGNKVIIQSESLHKYDRKNPPDLLVIDECTTVMEQAHSIMTHKDKYKANFQALMWLIKFSGRRIFMDANMDKSFIDEIQHIDKSVNRSTTNKLIVLKPKVSNRKMFLMKSEPTMMTWLAKNKHKKLFIVTTGGVPKTKSLKILFSELGIDKDSIAVYNSETTASIKSYDFEHCDTEWIKYQIVICSPTIGAGVDFSVPNYFNNVVGIFSNGSSTVQSARQFLRRVRNPVSDTYVLYEKKNYEAGPLTIKDMDHFICAKESNIINNFDSYEFEYLKTGRKQIIQTLAYLSRIRYEIRRNRSKQFFLSEFVEQETRAGCKVIYCDGNTKNRSDLERFRYAKNIVKAEELKDIHEAPMLDKDEVKAIDKRARENKDISKEEIYAMKKNYLRNVFNATEEQLSNLGWIHTYNKKDTIEKWFRIRQIVLNGDTTAESLKKLQEDARFMLHEIQRNDSDFRSDTKINKYWGQAVFDANWENHLWANRFLDLLGFANVWNEDVSNGKIFNTDIEVPRIDLEVSRCLINDDLMSDKIVQKKKSNTLEHVGRLFKKNIYGVKKAEGFKNIKCMLQWINPCLYKMYGLKIKAKDKGKNKNIFVINSSTDELFSTLPNEYKPNILYKRPKYDECEMPDGFIEE